MFGMKSPGVANKPLWVDFAYRSEHLMAVVGKQLTQAFYGKAPELSYWNGCSTGGRQGLMMAQRFPEDYNGILAGAPAIHWIASRLRRSGRRLRCFGRTVARSPAQSSARVGGSRRSV